MPFLFADAETFWDSDYTLRSMTTAEYILDARFEELGWSVAVDNEPSHWVDGPDMPRYLAQFDPREVVLIAFNTLFDGGILAWRHGFVPGLLLDSMGMARAVIGHKLKGGASLAAVAAALALPAKGTTVNDTKGKRRADIIGTPLWGQLQSYANLDNDLNRDVFKILAPRFPAGERKVMDLVLRCAIEPGLQVNRELLVGADGKGGRVKEIQDNKERLLRECGLEDRKALMSTGKFTAALEALGITMEYKVSPATGRKIPALAKIDNFMNALLEHPDPRVQTLAAARVGHRSTIEETRAIRFAKVAGLAWPSGEPLLPVPLRYGAAHTHRLGGTDSLNLQNLTKKSALRMSIVAGPGYVLIVADLSQIEARMTAWLARCMSLLEQFAQGLDPYSIMASHIFGFEVDKDKHPVHRFIGKIAVLGLGYGCGWSRFYQMVIMFARLFKVDLGDMWTESLALKTVDTYRRVYWQIPLLWRTVDALIKNILMMPNAAPYMFGPVTFAAGRSDALAFKVGNAPEIRMPGGLALHYDNLRMEDGDILYDYGRSKNIRLHGPKCTENIIQTLARLVVMDAGVRLAQRGLRFRLQAHDELVFRLPVEGGQYSVDESRGIIAEEMTRPPVWVQALALGGQLPYLPLAVDVSKPCQSYGSAK